jgi:hypothetical protein
MEYKALPKGISDYKLLMDSKFYFVDKTPFIEKIEKAGNFLFFLRPRRFGKSLFLSMLQTYYDVKERDNFARYFADTWIYNHPTEYRAKYQVLMFDFSKIGDSGDNIREKFNLYCCSAVNDFLETYKESYPELDYNEIRNSTEADDKLNKLSLCAKRLNFPLYLIIDEYDNFTNTILAKEGHDMYHAITHASGFYRSIFKIFKGSFARIIMTGVSPITLDDLTSGYNIATNITLTSLYNEVLGFSTEEVWKMLRYYQSVGVLRAEDEEKMMNEMEVWYDGYCFSSRALKKGIKMFNSCMVIRYIQSYIDEGEAPENLIDPNTKTDYEKMKQLLKLDTKAAERGSVLLKIAQTGYSYGNIADSFPAEQLLDPQNFLSLLYYYGMLTYALVDDNCVMAIPNNNVRKQYYDYLQSEYNKISHTDTYELDRCCMQAARFGNWRELIEYICTCYHENASIRCLIEGERNFQGYMMAFLRFNNYYQATPELELNYGYSDFFLLPRPEAMGVKHSYIIELKYLPLTATSQAAEKQWQEAVEQVHGYAEGTSVRRLTGSTQLHTLVVQVKGADLLRAEEV